MDQKKRWGARHAASFFESLAQEHKAQAIALAHHADDQMETFFIRLMRGASLAGLVGMKAKDGLYIRPLLETKKQDILEYLKAQQISYALDSSNESTDFLRNRIRKSVIPALQHCDPRFDANFFGTHIQLTRTENFLQDEAQRTFKEICTEQTMNIKRLLALHPVVRTRVIILWLCSAKVPFTPSQGFFDEIARFLENSGTADHTFYGKWQICKNPHYACIKII
jgi:tRNA(Ile)-lysidine synthase